MNAPQLEAALRASEFFGDVSDEHLEQLLVMARYVEFPAGKVIFREGDSATDIYLILTGEVAIEFCAPGVGCRSVVSVGPDEVLGWSPVLQRARFQATARSITAVTAVMLNGRQLVTLCEHDLRFGYEFMRRAALALAQRLSAAQIQLLNVFGADA